MTESGQLPEQSLYQVSIEGTGLVFNINENDTWTLWQASNRDLYFINKNGKYYSKENLTQGFDEYLIRGIVDSLINQ